MLRTFEQLIAKSFIWEVLSSQKMHFFFCDCFLFFLNIDSPKISSKIFILHRIKIDSFWCILWHYKMSFYIFKLLSSAAFSNQSTIRFSSAACFISVSFNCNNWGHLWSFDLDRSCRSNRPFENLRKFFEDKQ